MKGDKVVGSVEMPCCSQYCCKYELNCYKGLERFESTHIFTLKRCVCNCHTLCGKLCGCCDGPANRLEFDVLDKDKNGQVGKLHKVHNGCANECFSMADKYEFEWPSNDPDEQAIFLAAVQFMDMLYFESNYWGHGGI